MHTIQIKNVTKRYNDILAVDNISLDIPSGELFGLLGPNGAGKSTLISMLCGIVPIDSGDIFIGGHSITKNPLQAKAHIGYVPQDIALFENLSIIDNLKFYGRIYGLKEKDLKLAIDEVFEMSGLGEKRKEKVSKLSGGMKRRLNIACAMLHHPNILIMDEPTVGIDPQSRNHILEFTKQLNKEKNTTILYTSHYMEEVDFLCNKLAILDLGKEITSGTKDSIYRQYTDENIIKITSPDIPNTIDYSLKKLNYITQTKLNKNNLDISVNSNYSLPEILSVLNAENVTIADLSVCKPSLEHIFLKLTGKSLRD